jgi:hypothetical protein
MSNLYTPAAFQGFGKTKDYFEGWYFKAVDKDEKNAFAIIAGVSICKDLSKCHSFVMFFDARNHKMTYFKYPVNDFWADKYKFEIKIGKNFFSSARVQLDMDDGTNKVTADLKFKNIIPWPVSMFSPGVMGWYRFVPFMECYHANISFDHAIEGNITQNGQFVDMTGGKGYIEKDWGTSMPQSWIWMQTNHFELDGVSLFCSIAKIPWLGSYFTGYIFGFLYNKQLYKFTTYNGARVDKLSVTDSHIEILAENKGYYLEIKSDRTAGVDLPAPKLGEMTARVNESLMSNIEVKFSGKTPSGRAIIFTGTGRNSGLEFVGDIKELLRGFKK